PKTYTQPNLATTQSTQPNNCTTPPNTTPLKQVNKVTAEIATGKRPDPSRTRKLSLPAPMILPNPGGKVGHRRTQFRSSALQFRLEGRGVFIALFNRIERAQCGFSPYRAEPFYDRGRHRIR